MELFGEIPQFVVIVDANAIISDLIFLASTARQAGVRTALQESITSGALIAFAPEKLREEVESAIPSVAKRKRIRTELLLGHWREFQRLIIFEKVPPLRAAPEAKDLIDPDDVDYVHLSQEIRAHGIVTTDRHIPAMGGHAVPKEWVRLVRDLSRARAESSFCGILWIAGFGITIDLGQLVLSGLATVRKLPGWVLGLIFFGSVLCLMDSAKRKAIQSTVSEWSRFALELGREAVVGLLQMHTAAEDEARRKRAEIEVSVFKGRRPPLRLVAYRICRSEGYALTADQIWKRVKLDGHRSRARDPLCYLRRILRKNDCFVEVREGLWSARSVGEA